MKHWRVAEVFMMVAAADSISALIFDEVSQLFSCTPEFLVPKASL